MAGKKLDVKVQSGGTMLPKGMYGQASSSKSSKSKDDDYFVVPKEDAKTTKGGKLVGQSPPLGKEDPRVSRLYPLLSIQGDPAKIIRDELLASRSHSKGIDEWKHFYVNGGTQPSTTETSIAYCRVVGGTASNSRTTNTIHLHRTVVRLQLYRNPTGVSTAATVLLPTLTMLHWVDKIPATPGSVPTIYGTDANPPASDTLMFSKLGNATQPPQLCVRNPLTKEDYHVYKHDVHFCGDQNYTFVVPATPTGIATPHIWNFEYVIDYNGRQQQYAAYNSSAPCINDLYFTFILDAALTNQGYTLNMVYTFDTEFKDVQL